MDNHGYESEFYFDYKFYVLKDELGLFGGADKDAEDVFPRLWVERDYSVTGVEYGLYIAFPQWYNQSASDKKAKVAREFDIVRLAYTPKELELPVRGDADFMRDSKVLYIDPEVGKTIKGTNKEDYTSRFATGSKSTGNQYRHMISRNANAFSGVGELRFYRNNDSRISVLSFGSNFGFKRKIGYRIIKKNGLVKVAFNNLDISEDIELKLRVYANGSYYPCLKAKQAEYEYETIVLQKKISEYSLQKQRLMDKRLFISFEPNSDDHKYYILQCIQNDTAILSSDEKALPVQVPFCPYCHKVMPVHDKEFLKKYRKGVVSCSGDSTKEVRFEITSSTKKKKYVKKVIYCDNELGQTMLNRVLPNDFLSNKHFKIAVTGTRRAGKSVYLSRLCEVYNTKPSESPEEFRLELSSSLLSNAASKFGAIDIAGVRHYEEFETEPISNTEKKERQTTVERCMAQLKDEAWHHEVPAYKKYIIDMDNFIVATEKAGDLKNSTKVDVEKDTLLYPFIFRHKKHNHIYMYDFAGEDADVETERLKTLLGMHAVPMGIFFVIPADDESGRDNLSAATRIKEIMTSTENDEFRQMRPFMENCPIAVILTKFDLIENCFDENCHCRRSDAMNMIKEGERFEGSLLDHHIRLSSAEIESYLEQKKLLPAFVNKNDENLKKLNISFFGVSSFSHSEAIKHVEYHESGNFEENHLQFACSPKRIELPFIWMMKQFGIIS